MGKLVASYIFPHPPMIVPGVGKGKEIYAQKTINAVREAAKDIEGTDFDTIIVTTPHGIAENDTVYIAESKYMAGNFKRFGDTKTKLRFENNVSVARHIIECANHENIITEGTGNGINIDEDMELDHGAMVPLYFVAERRSDFKIIHISVPLLPQDKLYEFGKCVARAVENSESKAIIIASGDMSHKLTEDAPYGYSPYGAKFDDLVVSSLKSNHIDVLLRISEDLLENAAQCGLGSFCIMLGANHGIKYRTDIFSYEGPYGVGYMVAKLNTDPYVMLAMDAVEAYVGSSEIIDAPRDLPTEMLKDKAGVFVSLKKHGKLRGCIGTTSHTQKNIAQEIINNAISSATRDPRFASVIEPELLEIIYSVDVLASPESIDSVDDLDVKKYGVIVKAGFRTGLLLPNLEGVETESEQVKIALQKAGIGLNDNYKLQRFEVIRHK